MLKRHSKVPPSKRAKKKKPTKNPEASCISEMASINLFAKQHEAKGPLKAVALKNGVMV